MAYKIYEARKSIQDEERPVMWTICGCSGDVRPEVVR